MPFHKRVRTFLGALNSFSTFLHETEVAASCAILFCILCRRLGASLRGGNGVERKKESGFLYSSDNNTIKYVVCLVQ